MVVERSTNMADVRRQLEERLAQQLDLLEINQINVSYSLKLGFIIIIEVLLRVQLKR